MNRPNYVFFIMGKSSTGKDTIFQQLCEQKDLGLKVIISYTTRPIRGNEAEGNEYHFTDEACFQAFQAAGSVVENRVYHTYHGLWRYFTVDDGQFDFPPDSPDRLMIGTLESFLCVKKYFPELSVVPLLIELDDGVRLERALKREMSQETPRYEEMCRRFLADTDDFAEDLIEDAGIDKRFYNHESTTTAQNIATYIRELRGK
ncbi:MAG: guanylate kinase [Lachnospiraceae bacterium]|jgi:guanylate kinase|nr:guanylate kinase [Lachnospiraceae bacterium]